MKYKQIKVREHNNVCEIIENTEKDGYEFVGFFYESDVYGLFNTYILFKENNL